MQCKNQDLISESELVLIIPESLFPRILSILKEILDIEEIAGLSPVDDNHRGLSNNPTYSLVEPLTEREFELLQLIAEGDRYQDIADRLSISINTVKAHARNINGKLGVQSRHEAIRRARELNLIDSHQVQVIPLSLKKSSPTNTLVTMQVDNKS